MVPSAGDIVWTELDPVKGTEQAGRRPAVVVSPLRYNEISPRVVICPISTNPGNWPFNVPLPVTMKSRGVVLVDQVRAVDRAERVFRLIERAPASVMIEVRNRLAALVAG